MCMCCEKRFFMEGRKVVVGYSSSGYAVEYHCDLLVNPSPLMLIRLTLVGL